MPSQRVAVVCRFKPNLSGEKLSEVKHDLQCFDRVYLSDDRKNVNHIIFKESMSNLVADAMSGVNVTVLAYGQTSSGKTHTMSGTTSDPGVMTLFVNDLFAAITKTGESPLVEATFVEIYMEQIRDLLATRMNEDRKLKAREDTVKNVWYIDGLEPRIVTSAADVFRHLEKGNQVRTVGSTAMNATSSRSHSVFALRIHRKNPAGSGTVTSLVSLVDLAGSESQSRTQAEGKRLDEAKTINKSLSALKRVIEAANTQGAHVPYRDSVLTRLLTDSIGGNSRTVMVVTCSALQVDEHETSTSIKYGAAACRVQNRAKTNVEMTIDDYRRALDEANAEIERLRSDGGTGTREKDEEEEHDDEARISLEKKLEDSAREREIIEREMRAATAEIEDLKREKKAATATRGELDGALQEIEALKREKKSATTEIESLRREKKATAIETDTIDREKRAALLEVETLRREKKAVAAERDRLQKEREDATLEIESLKKRAALEKEAFAREKKNKGLEIEALDEEKKAIALQTDTLQREKRAAELQIEALKREINAAALEKEAKEKGATAKIATLTEQADKLRREADSLRAGASEEAARQDTALADLEAMNAALRKTLARKEKEKDDAMRQAEREKSESVAAALARKDKEKEEASARHEKDKQAALAALRHEFERAAAETLVLPNAAVDEAQRVEELIACIRRLTEANQSLHAQLEDANKMPKKN